MASSNLNRDTIVQTSLGILQAHGLDAVSLRNVAAALRVRAPSLYWHVASKPDLLGLMSEAIFKGCLDSMPQASTWQDWLRKLGTQVWHMQQQTRDIHQLMMQSRMPPETLAGFTQRMVAELTARGLPPPTAFAAQKSVLALATGWTMMPNDPAFRINPPEHSFLRCLDAVIHGWEQGEQFA